MDYVKGWERDLRTLARERYGFKMLSRTQARGLAFELGLYREARLWGHTDRKVDNLLKRVFNLA